MERLIILTSQIRNVLSTLANIVYGIYDICQYSSILLFTKKPEKKIVECVIDFIIIIKQRCKGTL